MAGRNCGGTAGEENDLNRYGSRLVFISNLLVVSETLAAELFHRWMEKTSSSVASTEEEPPPSISALRQPPGVVTEPLQFSIKDGVRLAQELT